RRITWGHRLQQAAQTVKAHCDDAQAWLGGRKGKRLHRGARRGQDVNSRCKESTWGTNATNAPRWNSSAERLKRDAVETLYVSKMKHNMKHASTSQCMSAAGRLARTLGGTL